jgi:hypothetical protein
MGRRMQQATTRPERSAPGFFVSATRPPGGLVLVTPIRKPGNTKSGWNSDNVRLNRGMAKNPNRHPSVAAAPVAKRKRGRPPSPNGPKSQADIQRAYRARLAAAGKVVRLVDTVREDAPDLATFVGMREKLHNALVQLELQGRDVARLEARNAYLESELILQHQHHTNAIKDNVVLKRQLAEIARKSPKRRP